MPRRTVLVCKSCGGVFLLDINAVIAAAELELFVSAHIDCGGALLVRHHDDE